MDQKMQFILECQKGYFPFNELCSQFGISRKTGYKWLERYNEEGPLGLHDRSRRPYSWPCHDSKIVDAITLKSTPRGGWRSSSQSFPSTSPNFRHILGHPEEERPYQGQADAPRMPAVDCRGPNDIRHLLLPPYRVAT